MSVTELTGAEALSFAKESLRMIKTNSDTWEVEYIDEATGERWLLDYPNSEHHGGGSPRMRRIQE